MTTSQSRDTVSRRVALVGLSAGSLGAALTAAMPHASAQTPAADLAAHPIVGSWYATTPSGPAIAAFHPDGTVVMGLPATQSGPNGVQFVSSEVGTWEPVSTRGIHFTAIQLISDTNGIFTGTVTIDGFPVVNADGNTQIDDQSQSHVTIRDAAGNVLQEISGAGAPPVTGTRIAVGHPGLPTGGAATPTS